jgi:hypothetical protein
MTDRSWSRDTCLTGFGVKVHLCESRSCSVLSVWRAGGLRRGRREGNTIESWLTHSENIVVYLYLHS